MMASRLALTALFSSSMVAGLSVDEQTITLEGSAACVRLYNNGADGWVGCSTPREGVTYPIYGIDVTKPDTSLSQLKGFSSKRAILLSQSLFTKDMITKLEATGNLGGLLLYEQTPPSGFSPASTVNNYNPTGTGFTFKQFSYPIVRIEAAQQAKILTLAGKNQKAVDSTMLLPTYKAKFQYYMGPTDKKVTSEECLLWKDLFGDIRPQCQALGGLSVWATTQPIETLAVASKGVVMASSGIDAASLFHDLVPGADAPASSVVAILAAADAISKWGNAKTLPSIIGYSLFQGEAWDTIGSRRFVYDIARYQGASSCNNTVAKTESPTGRSMCLDPLRPSEAFQSFGGKLENLKAVVGVDQVSRGTGANAYIHTDDAAWSTPAGVNLDKATTTANGLPPSPVDSFRLLKAAVPGYVISGYDETFSNKFYHSQFDNFTTTSEIAAASEKIAAASTALAKTLIYLANDKTMPDVSALTVNQTLVKDLLTCIIGDWKCPLFTEYLASTYANLEAYLNADQLRFSSVSPGISARKPSLYASVASISQIPPTLPYITLTVQDIPNYVFSLPKCAKGATNTPDKELCMLCDEAQCNLKSKEALMQNIHVVTFPENVYEAFLRSFMVKTTSSDITTIKCNSTADCRANKDVPGGVGNDYECHTKQCLLPSAHYHSAISPAIDPTPNGEIYKVDKTLCTGPNKWICGKNGVEMLWTEPNWAADIGVTIYPDGGNAIAWVALCVGLVVFVVGYLGARSSLAGLQKQKLL